MCIRDRLLPWRPPACGSSPSKRCSSCVRICGRGISRSAASRPGPCRRGTGWSPSSSSRSSLSWPRATACGAGSARRRSIPTPTPCPSITSAPSSLIATPRSPSFAPRAEGRHATEFDELVQLGGRATKAAGSAPYSSSAAALSDPAGPFPASAQSSLKSVPVTSEVVPDALDLLDARHLVGRTHDRGANPAGLARQDTGASQLDDDVDDLVLGEATAEKGDEGYVVGRGHTGGISLSHPGDQPLHDVAAVSYTHLTL